MRYLLTWTKLGRDIEERVYREFGVEPYIHREGRYTLYTDKPPIEDVNGILVGVKTHRDTRIVENVSYQDYKEIDEVLDGRYVYIDFLRDAIYRDPLGLKPAYIGVNGIASDKRLLWILRNRTPYSIPPNYIWSIGERGNLDPVGKLVSFPSSPEYDGDIEEHAREIGRYLLYRMRKIAEHVKHGEKRVYIAFSGGVDSSLTYVLAEKTGLKPIPVTVCKKGAYDEKASLESARLLGATDNHIVMYLDETIAEEDIRRIVGIVEDPNLMQVSLSIPLYVLAKEVAGGNVLLMGQGSDELFGGYQKYIDKYREKGAEDAEKEIRLDVLMSHRFNFSREDKIASEYDMDLWYPLISPGIVYYVFSKPLSFKIKGLDDETRKWLIRKISEYIGLPRKIIYRKKKAMQYSSKSQDMLIKTLGKKKVSKTLYHFYLDIVMSYFNEWGD